jgi:hypothetical protein
MILYNYKTNHEYKECLLVNLKEACRLQNVMESNISSLSSYIRNESNVVKITETHQKSKSNQDAQDEVLEMIK